MAKQRHELFQHLASALQHEQHGNAPLAFAYWEQVLRALPPDIHIQHEIVQTCQRLFGDGAVEQPPNAKIQLKLAHFADVYQQPLTDAERELAQIEYRALCQQCGGNHALACVFWQQVVRQVSSQALIITLAAQDLCWQADQFISAGNTARGIELYQQMLRALPDFLEGYVNLSLILFKSGRHDEIESLFQHIPPAAQQEFLVRRYRDFYARIAAIAAQVENVPYVAIESIVTDLRIENTFYPSIYHDYFTDLITELVSREQRFFEKRRKAFEEKAIAMMHKHLAQTGMSLGHRVTLAKHAKLAEIPQFLNDLDIRIVEVLLDNANVTAEDVLVIAQTCPISEILRFVAQHRKWGALQPIRLAVLLNPQTLAQDALHLLDALMLHDLAKVFYQKSLSAEVRIRAHDRIQEIFAQLTPFERIAAIEASAGELCKLIERVSFDLSSFLLTVIPRFQDKPDIIVNLCRWKLTPAAILAYLAKNSLFTTNLRILFALLANPKTPVETATALLTRLPHSELHDLARNTHLPPAVRAMIPQLFPPTGDE